MRVAWVDRKSYAGLLIVAAAAIYVAYATFLPAFEGPDEPFHLSRALDLARGHFVAGWRADHLGDDVTSALARFACGPDLHRVFDCPPFATEVDRSWGNLLSESPSGPTRALEREPYPNYERQHPLLGYLVWSIPVAVVDGLVESWDPVRRVAAAQLTIRITNLTILAIALLGPGRRLIAPWSIEARLLAMGIMLLPGAVETLARGGLEALVFSWSVWFVEDSVREGPRPGRILVLAAIGPLIKLTAIPVVAFGAMTVWWRRQKRLAVGIVASSMAVYMERLLGGYLGGGVLDLHGGYSTHDPGGVLEMLQGIGWSMLVTMKSAAWLGGWSFFRPPLWVVALLVGSVGVLSLRVRLAAATDRSVTLAGLGAAAVAITGHAVFSVAVYRVFGSWAVGGWYVWAWFPMAAVAAERSLAWRRPVPTWVWLAAGISLLAIDIAWWLAADRLYG